MATLIDEPGRLAALDRYAVLDTPAEAQFDRITMLVSKVLKVPMAAVSLIDGHRQWFKSAQGLDVAATARQVSFCTHTIQTRSPMLVPDARRDPRFAANPLVTGAPFIHSYAGVPLTTPDGQNVGALCAFDTVPRCFDKAEIDLLSTFAALVVDELELRMIAQTDYLTGAMSRRAIVHDMQRALARHDRMQEPAAILTLDVDRFKAINDSLGHPVGDLVLTTLVDACSQKIRAQDSFGRLGGEEFALLLADTTLDQAVVAAERFRAAIAAMTVPGHPGLHVTASFGVTAMAPGDDVVGWLARADRALYAAKDGGRNRCCVA